MKIFIGLFLVAVVSFVYVSAGASDLSESDEECTVRCNLPKPSTGRRVRSQRRSKNYYYNSKTQKCTSFYIYGQRASNNSENRFLSRDDCEETCGSISTIIDNDDSQSQQLTNQTEPAELQYDYIWMPSLMSVAQAIEICSGRDVNGALVSIETHEEDETISSDRRGFNEDMWTSGRRNSTREPFVWTSTGHVLGNYTHWATPKEQRKVGCIYIRQRRTRSATRWAWYVGNCSNRKGAVCQIEKF